MAPYARPNFEPRNSEEFIQWRRDHIEAMMNDRKERRLEMLVYEKRLVDHIKSKYATSFSATEALVMGYIQSLWAEVKEFNETTSKSNKALQVIESSPVKKPPHQVRKTSGGDRKTSISTPEKNANYIEIDPSRLRFPRFSASPKSTMFFGEE
uniref:Uncharacterized protein n=1 Tax=Steinernema glaseri TaxID=37863 RepID=A0A1I7Y112_9BILA